MFIFYLECRTNFNTELRMIMKIYTTLSNLMKSKTKNQKNTLVKKQYSNTTISFINTVEIRRSDRDLQVILNCNFPLVINYIERLNKYKVPPSSSGLIKRSGSEKELNVKDYNLTKPYVSALSCSVKDLNIKNLTLSSINRNDEGVAEIFKNLSSGIEKLD